MAKKILAIALIAIVAVSAAACFAACEEEPTPYADLVAVRVNNFMAEWENIDYNFTYEGSSALKVSVPYTNYLEVNDLIVSPGAEYKVYEDEGKTKQLTDLSKIYVDGAKTLYIDVTNGELSNSYSVDVTVEQTNLPPESEIADKQYDNRGGHIYIPEGAETVVIDDIEYKVIRDSYEANYNNEDVILANDIHVNITEEEAEHEASRDFFGIFNGNGYAVFMYCYSESMFNDLGHTALIKNVIFKLDQYQSVANFRQYAQAICRTNYGVIENVVTDINLSEHNRYIDEPARYGFFAAENYGTIENCMNKGNIVSQFNNLESLTASIVTCQFGELINCVNTGIIQNEFPEKGSNGIGAIAYLAIEDAVFKGVFNVGEVTHTRMPDELFDEKLNGMIFSVNDDYPVLDSARNYTLGR